jgi:streptomycin 3"-adenylyltransferase
MDALRAPRSVTSLLGRIGERFRHLLGENLVGVYLHGSLAFGCFNPDASDVDVLVVVRDRLDAATKRRIADALIALSRDAPAKGVEVSVVTQASLRDFRHPTPYEFHFSHAWIERYAADEVDFEAERTDPDLAAHLTVVRERGVRLVGAPIAEVIPPIPRHAYLRSIANDAADAGRNLAADPVSGVLNLCRVLAFIREGLVTSKAEGGRWAARHAPAGFVPLVRAALDAYAQADRSRLADGERLHAFAAYATREIGQALDER